MEIIIGKPTTAAYVILVCTDVYNNNLNVKWSLKSFTFLKSKPRFYMM